MPYHPTINSLERSRTWEGDDSNPNSLQRRFSLSSPGELGNRTSPIPRSPSFSDQQEVSREPHLPTPSKLNRNSAFAPSRVERLLRERQLRRNNNNNSSNSLFPFQDEGDSRSADFAKTGSNERVGIKERDGPHREEGSDHSPGLGTTYYERNRLEDGRPFKQRLLVVANRLPVSATRIGEDSWSLEISAGGLVSALLGVKQFEAKWIGWAGVNVPDEAGQIALSKALAEKCCIPVFLDEEIVHQYYNGYCNNVLWPLFHYLGLPQEDRLAATRSLQSQFDAYKKANQMFADVVYSHYKEGDVVWCHDYHLMFLPKCLKEYDSHMKVGWFLHTPFPSSEIYRTLPSRSELLKAVLAADLVGFHTYDYARHFVSACTRILGLEGTPEGVEDQGKLTRVAAVHEIVGRINGRFGTLTTVPIHHLDRSLDFHQLCALYAITDVALVTSLRDGMNLVSYEVVACQNSKKGVLILSEGFNATMTAQVDSPGRRGHDQIKEMKLRLHPDLRETLSFLCKDPKTTIVILSGSERNVLDENFGEFDMWLAAENGMFLRHTKREWMTTMPEHLNMDWMESVQLVFDYFRERTPRSYVEVRETSLVWNYKYADAGVTDFEFGRVQARDMLQHLWTGPISNASVEVVQGSRSVEVRSVGVSKGAAIDRILGEIVHSKPMITPIDYVLCIGHFLGKDEDIYTFFEPELPLDREGNGIGKLADVKIPVERRTAQKPSPAKGGNKATRNKATTPALDKKGSRSKSSNTKDWRTQDETVGWHEGSSVLDLKGENYFSCAVCRKGSNARYSLPSSEDVVRFLKAMARSYSELGTTQRNGMRPQRRV